MTHFLREQSRMSLPWLVGGFLPGVVVAAYCVAVSWARHLTPYWMPCRQGLMWEGVWPE